MDGAKIFIGESEQIDNFRFVAGCFGSLTVTEIFELESNSKSAHKQCEEGSNEF